MTSRIKATVEQRTWLGFAVVVIVGGVMGWLIYANADRVQNDRDAVARTNETVTAIGAAFASLHEVESGQRGYIITGKPEYLTQFNDGARAVGEDLARLGTLLAQDPLQQERLTSLEALAREKISFARESMAIRDSRGEDAADQVVAAGRGKAILDEARAVFASMKDAENEHLRDRTATSDAATRNSWILATGLAALSLGLFAILLAAITRSLASQRRAAEVNARFSATVAASNDAIVGTDLDGRITQWNAGAERIFGYSSTEALGQLVSILAPADRVGTLRADLAAGRRGGGVVDRDEVALTKDGRRLDVSLSSFPIFGAAGELTGSGAIVRDMSERKRTEEALHETEARWAAAYQASPIAISIVRLSDSSTIDVNEAWLELFEFSREAVIGQTTLDLGLWLDPEGRPNLLKRLEAEPSGHDVPRVLRTGSGRIIESVTSWERLQFGGETCTVIFTVDITDRKQAERDRERVFTLSSDLIAVAGFDGHLRRTNPAAHDRLGYSDEELLAIPFFDLFHQDDHEAAMAAVGRLASGDRSVTIAGRLLTKDGSYLRVEIAASAEPGEQVLYAVARDVTARWELEAALRAGEERFRSVIETATDGIIITDRLGIIEVFNHAAKQMFGYTTAEAVGRNVNILIPSPYKEQHDGFIAAFHARGTSEVLGMRRELFGERKDGSLFPHDLTVNAMRLGDEVHFAAVIRDITAQTKLESDLHQARDVADEANRTKSAFLSRMSHELRTPLNVVLGFAQVLQLDPLEPQQTESVDYILKAGRHLLELIDEVLDISRIEAGRISLSLEPVDANELVADVLTLMRPLASQRRITIHADLDSHQCFVVADRQRLKQVLLNLLANAIKYNRQGGTVDVACAKVGDSALRIEVADSGPGIAPEKLDRLFVAFDRLGAEATDVEGTGLGLALSRHLVEAMGGTIGVESTIEVGSTFWIELPLAEEPAHAPEETPRAVGNSLPRLTGQRTVLYIEDNLANLNLMERILVGRLGFRLLTAMQGSLGIDLAIDHHPDVIFLDLHLPDIPGNEVFDRLQQNPATCGIPVVVVSADATTGQIARLREAGVRAYITKPFDLKELLDVVDSLHLDAN